MVGVVEVRVTDGTGVRPAAVARGLRAAVEAAAGWRVACGGSLRRRRPPGRGPGGPGGGAAAAAPGARDPVSYHLLPAGKPRQAARHDRARPEASELAPRRWLASRSGT